MLSAVTSLGRAGRLRAAVLLLPLLTLAAYASALSNGFVWDDHAVIEKGGLIGSLKNIPALYSHNTMWNSDGGDFARRATIDTYRPFTLTTFALERAVFGLSPRGYHLVSVLLHAGNAVLLLLLALRVGMRLPVGIAGAALFAVHPSISEAVHWVNGRSDPLMVGCFLSALLLWCRFLDAVAGPADPRSDTVADAPRCQALFQQLTVFQPLSRAARARVATVGLAVAGLALLGTLCKETIFLVAGGLPLLLWRRRVSWRCWPVALAPWASGLAVGFGLRMAALGRPAVSGGGYHLAHAAPRVPVIWADALTSLTSPAPRLVPSLHHAYADVSGGRMALALVIIAAVVAASAWAWRRGHLLLPWSVVTLLLALAPIAMLTYAEGWAGWGRYLYPAAPLFALAVSSLLLDEIVPRAGPLARRLLLGLGALALLVCVVQTFLAGRVWRDDESLARGWIEEAPGSAPGYLALGLVYYERQQPQRALPLFAAAVERAPANAEMHAKLALAHSALGQRAEAWQAAQRALVIDPANRLGRYIVALGLLSQPEGDRRGQAAELLVTLLAEDPDEGLWQTMDQAWSRNGPGSAFRLRAEELFRQPRYRNIGLLLRIRVNAH